MQAALLHEEVANSLSELMLQVEFSNLLAVGSSHYRRGGF